MLNYIKAELWKASRSRGLHLLALILILLTGLFTAIMLTAEEFSQMSAAAAPTMLLGVLVAPLITRVIDGEVMGTMKNEVSFGLSRRRIYLGKLAAGLLLGMGLCLVLLGGYCGIGWLAQPHGVTLGEDLDSIQMIGYILLGAFPIWCGIYSLCHMLAMLVPNTVAWMGIYYLLSLFGQPILAALAILSVDGQMRNLLQAILMPALLLIPYYLTGWLTWEYQIWCWAIGLGWGIASITVGLLYFSRKEIRS